MSTKRLLLIIALIGLIVAYFGFDLGRFLSLDYFKSQQEAIESVGFSAVDKFLLVWDEVFWDDTDFLGPSPRHCSILSRMSPSPACRSPARR